MKILGIVLTIVLIAISGIAIALIMMQESKSEGMTGFGGGAETFFSRNKSASKEQRLNFYTKVSIYAFVTLSVLIVIIQQYAV